MFIYGWKLGNNAIIFRADISSSVHIYDKNKDTLIFIERPTQGLDDTILTTEAKYAINSTKSRKKICIKSTL